MDSSSFDWPAGGGHVQSVGVRHLTAFAAGIRIPPFVIGITLVSIGTDLSEIANSVVAFITNHGDINVGDSIGSATVQGTLIPGLLPIIAGSIPISRRRLARSLRSVAERAVRGVLIGIFLVAYPFITGVS